MKTKIKESNQNQAATAGQNAQDEPTAESGSTPLAEAAFENPAGSGSAPSPCSAQSGISDKQSSENYQSAINRLKQISNSAQNLGESANFAASSVRHLGSLLSGLSESVGK